MYNEVTIATEGALILNNCNERKFHVPNGTNHNDLSLLPAFLVVTRSCRRVMN